LGLDFLEGYRFQAISEALAARDDWDIASTMRLQTDQRALAWTELRDHVLQAKVEGPALEGQKLLRDWDGIVSEGSPAASVYEIWLAGMARAVAKAKAPKSWEWVVGGAFSPLTPYGFGSYRRTAHLVGLLREGPTWQETVGRVLGETVEFLRGQFGEGPKNWAWGSIRPLVMHHPVTRGGGVMGTILRWVFNLGPVPCGGDADVINQAAVQPLSPIAPADNIAAMRMAVDVGQWHNSRWALPGGQSGNPMSPHYGDLLPLWQRGEGIPIAFTPDEVKAATVEQLRLCPQGH
jgi:penicillin amidase